MFVARCRRVSFTPCPRGARRGIRLTKLPGDACGGRKGKSCPSRMDSNDFTPGNYPLLGSPPPAAAGPGFRVPRISAAACLGRG